MLGWTLDACRTVVACGSWTVDKIVCFSLFMLSLLLFCWWKFDKNEKKRNSFAFHHKHPLTRKSYALKLFLKARNLSEPCELCEAPTGVLCVCCGCAECACVHSL